MLAGLAGSKNPCRPYGTARPQRPLDRRISDSPQKSEKSLLSRTPRTSAARTGSTPDERLRLDDHLRDRITLQRQKNVEEGSRMLAGRVSRRGRDPDLAPRHHDPRCPGRKRQKRNRNHRWIGPHFGRNRKRERHPERSGRRPGHYLESRATTDIARHFSDGG